MWGDTGKQEHYREGRSITEVLKSEIAAVCRCGFIELKPRGAFEEHNGGLTVKRSQVVIVDDRTGACVKVLRGRSINHYDSCNACVNDWK
jgi:hypothetical protein